MNSTGMDQRAQSSRFWLVASLHFNGAEQAARFGYDVSKKVIAQQFEYGSHGRMVTHVMK